MGESSSQPATTPEFQSTFQRALDEYIKSLPENKQKRNFIAACYNPSNPVTPDIVNDSIKKIEADHSQRSSTVLKVFKKVVAALKDYDDIVKTLASADPMPTAIIWGALSVIINGAQRFFDVFDTIRKELRTLANELERIAEFENLFGDCTKLQDLLCKTYINLFRFWNQVHKELNRPAIKSIASAAFSFHKGKLTDMIDDITENVNEIDKHGTILSEKKMKEEREKAELERGAQSGWRKKQDDDNFKNTVYNWLKGQKVTQANLSRYEEFQGRRMDGTCDWLIEHPAYSMWRKGMAHSPVLWLHAPPGAGKSTLCSLAIHSIEESDTKIGLAYHFYRFDEPFRALEVLKHLAYQLFLRYLSLNPSSEVLQALAEKVKVQGDVSPLQCARDFISSLVENIPRVYIFIDGLDEEAGSDRWKEAEAVLDFLQKLTKEFPGTVRIWNSSQNVARVKEKLEASFTFDIKEQMKSDIIFYISNEMAKLDLPVVDRGAILHSLTQRAGGNFLWARLMISELAEANSPADMARIIEKGPTLDEYYKKFFARLEKNDRPLACYIFALVAFARRPLRLKELREAIGMLKSRDVQSESPSLDRAEIPYKKRLLKFFAPLIEVGSDCDDDDDCTCRLFHSTVLDFLQRNAEVLCNGLPNAKDQSSQSSSLRVCPRVIADTCLLYLSQARYSQLLTRRGDSWFDIKGNSVADHHFLTYSAKYWDKHLDCYQVVKPPSPHDVEEYEKFHSRVNGFVTSPNFQTCLQVQSLWVGSQFGVFFIAGGDECHGYLRRVLPDWFTRTLQGRICLSNYHRFWYDWQFFLNCGTCDVPTCVVKPYVGELDRCWWTALGSHNFLSKMRSRYTSFRFQSDENLELGRKISFDGVDLSRDAFRILRLNALHEGQLEFSCELWSISAERMPSFSSEQTIVIKEASINWLQYMEYTDEDAKVFQMRKDRALPVSFSEGLQILRIGSQVYTQKETGDYMAIPSFGARKRQDSSYIEEIAGRGRFVVLTSRRCAIADRELQDGAGHTPSTSSSAKSKSLSQERSPGHDERRCDIDSDDEDSEYSDNEIDSIHDDSDTSYETDEAYESWSECSSGDSNDSDFEDDMVSSGQCMADDDDDDGDSSNADSSQDDAESESAESSDTDDKDSSESSSEESDVDPRVFRYGQRHNYGEEIFDSDDEECRSIMQRRKKKKEGSGASPARPKLQASITIFNTLAPVPEVIFRYSRKLTCMLYGSPPVIHPLHPLVVWPLGGGSILFIDFMANTYFIRKLRPSTRHTRHIFMKFRFSDCGAYLHIASLEGQHKSVPRQGVDKDEAQFSMELALLVSTYRLCGKKPNRCPPTLANRVRVELGSVISLSVSKLPYTLTWTAKELYFTCSNKILKVYRVQLFKAVDGAPGNNAAVLRPRETVFLPDSAEKREVYYVPPVNGSSIGRIIVGSEGSTEDVVPVAVIARLCFSPPVGCDVDEQTDLGGWISSSDQTDCKNQGDGHLIRPLEKFDPEEDCDLEPFLFLGY